MKTTIDNNQRVFLVREIGWSSNKFFCNLSQIPECIGQIEKNQDFEVYEYWNHRLKKLSVKKLNEIFAANQIDFKLI